MSASSYFGLSVSVRGIVTTSSVFEPSATIPSKYSLLRGAIALMEKDALLIRVVPSSDERKSF